MSGIAVEADAMIHRHVLEELKWDTRVDETGVVNELAIRPERERRRPFGVRSRRRSRAGQNERPSGSG
jgi:hypothetical protein